MTLFSVAESISDLSIDFRENQSDYERKKKKMSRPYGVCLLIGGVDESGPKLFQTGFLNRSIWKYSRMDCAGNWTCK